MFLYKTERLVSEHLWQGPWLGALLGGGIKALRQSRDWASVYFFLEDKAQEDHEILPNQGNEGYKAERNERQPTENVCVAHISS
jgi:hypothetical protein